MRGDYTVTMAAHNEEKYIEKALLSILYQTTTPKKVIVILDRCTDRTPLIVKKMANRFKEKGIKFEIIEKKSKKWFFSYAENLELARCRTETKYYSIVDADVELSRTYFEELIENFDYSRDFALGGEVFTCCKNILCSLIRAWENSYRFGLRRWPRGCALLINKSLLDKLGGFRDTPAPDTDILSRALKKGYRVRIISNVYAFHRREVSLPYIINRQFKNGIYRYIIGISLLRTLLHSIVRVRPFTLLGYVYAIILKATSKRFRTTVKLLRKRLNYI